MYFTPKQIQTNTNTQYGLNPQLQLQLTNGNVQFMIELAKQMRISYTIPSLALHISQIFFQKKCYLFYDRFIILTASFALASKLKDIDCRLKTLCNCYYNIVNKMTMQLEPFNEEKMKKIKDQICIAQTQILRTLQYRLDFVTPHDYLKKYVETLRQPKEVIKKVFNTARIIILDSYRTRCCLHFNPLVICISALLIASRYEGFRPYFCDMVDEELKKKEQLSSSKSKNQNMEKEQSQREQGEIVAQIDEKSNDPTTNKHQEHYKCWLEIFRKRENEQIEEREIFECVAMMNNVVFEGFNKRVMMQENW